MLGLSFFSIFIIDKFDNDNHVFLILYAVFSILILFAHAHWPAFVYTHEVNSKRYTRTIGLIILFLEIVLTFLMFLLLLSGIAYNGFEAFTSTAGFQGLNITFTIIAFITTFFYPFILGILAFFNVVYFNTTVPTDLQLKMSQLYNGEIIQKIWRNRSNKKD